MMDGIQERASLPLALEHAALALQRHNAAGWDDFVAALAVEHDAIVASVIDAPIDDLPATQGRLQAVTMLLHRLRHAAHTVERASRQHRMAAQQRKAMAAGIDNPLNGH